MTSININAIFEAAQSKQGFRYGERKTRGEGADREDCYGWTTFGKRSPIPMKNAPSLPYRFGVVPEKRPDNVQEMLSTVEIRAGIESGEWRDKLGSMAMIVRGMVPFAELIVAPEIIITTKGQTRKVKDGAVADFVGMVPTVSVPVRRTAILISTSSPAADYLDTIHKACWQALEMEMRRHPTSWGPWIAKLTESIMTRADAEFTFKKSPHEARRDVFNLFAKSETYLGARPVYDEDEFDTGELDEEGQPIAAGSPFFQTAFEEVKAGVVGFQLYNDRNALDIYLTEADKKLAA